MQSKFAFLASPRFWKLAVIGALAGATYMYPNSPWIEAATITFGIWFGGSVAVGTIDRYADKQATAAVVPTYSGEK